MYYYTYNSVRLACLIHAASVRSEPESNSPLKSLSLVLYKRKFLTIQLLKFSETVLQLGRQIKKTKPTKKRTIQQMLIVISYKKLFAFWILPISIKFELGFQKSVTLFLNYFLISTPALVGSLPDLIWTKTEINFAWCVSPAGQRT